MTSKEIIVVKDENGEISQFLRKLIAEGSLCVELDSELYHVNIRREKLSKPVRRKLLQAPVVDD